MNTLSDLSSPGGEMPAEILQVRQEIVERAKTLQIVDQGSYDLAAESLAFAASLEKRIIEHYEPLRVTAKGAYDAVLEAKRKDLEPVLEVKSILSRATAKFDLEQQRLRDAEQAKQDEWASAKAAEKRRQEIENAKALGASKEEVKEMKAAPITFVSPEIDPTHRRSKLVSKPVERWSAQVLGDDGLMLLVRAVAAGKAQLQLLLPNQVALNKMACAFKDNMNLPGVKASCEYTTSVRGGL